MDGVAVAAADDLQTAKSDLGTDSRSGSATAGHSNVFARLHALLPGSAVTTNASYSTPPSGGDAATHSMPPKTRPPPQFLKVRIITWNMHDSLPKGNLEDLLGAVPAYTAASDSEREKSRIPAFTNEEGHLYHIVVVAGQECPSVSGIPMGLGAGLIKKDRDRLKEPEGKPPKTKHKEKFKGKDKEYIALDDEQDSPEENSFTSPQTSAHALSGWSSILEQWYCRGSGSPHSSSSKVSLAAMTAGETERNEVHRPLSLRDHKRKDEKGLHSVGPYELLVKERMMGIYLAIYIHRDIRHLIRGTSKSAVASGLIGGRVGNKGGVGVSINLDGITLLFINAHLAAHEDKMALRLANLAKIKAELNVDDFLHQDDPRVMAEDLTDRFDHMFLFGDLNFRLDVTRLHADWLISRQDYAQALAFDQLHKLMKYGLFVGFHEAAINFPPTFKYDVLRTLKRSKSHRRDRRHKLRPPDLSEVEEKPIETRIEGDDEDLGDVQPECELEESASVTSTAWTSLHSRHTSEADDDNYDYFKQTPSHLSVGQARKMFITNAAHKAKSKWLSLLPSSNPMSPTGTHMHPKIMDNHPLIPASQKAFRPPALQLSPPQAASAIELGRSSDKANDFLLPGFFKRARSTASTHGRAKRSEEGQCDKGVYDSSSKQRVPSWCDRILWKSTVQPEPYEEDEEIPSSDQRAGVGLGPRVAHFLAQAFRPLSTRGRGASYSSNEIPPATATGHEHQTAPPETRPPMKAPTWSIGLPNIFQAKPEPDRPPKLYHSKSVDTPSTIVRPPVSPLAPRNISRPRQARSLSATHIVSEPIVPSPRSANFDSDTQLPANKEIPSIPPKDPLNKASSSRWRIFPFLSRDTLQGAPIDVASPTAESVPVAPRPRRGDVIPLGYNTLDDQAMRRLEGRSDHRPVIGSYAIYI